MPCDDFWTTKDGQKIAYHDMETRHLNNVIRMLERMEAEQEDLVDSFGDIEWVPENQLLYHLEDLRKELLRRELL